MPEEFINKFLTDIQRGLGEVFGMSVAVCKTVDANGNILLRLTNLPEVCKMIMESKKGQEGCNASCGAANALVKEKDEPMLITCHAGYIGFYYPIVIDNEKLGGITGCVAIIPEEIDKDAVKEKFEKLADNYGLDKEKFVAVATKEFKAVSEKEKERILSLMKNVIEEEINVYKVELKEFFLSKK